jgi:DNA-binding SARP family transcriptional activator/DNA-binding CsgD family transcriptional regulator
MQRALFAILVVHRNELASVDRLIDDLWDGRTPRTAVKSVQTYVSRLREEFGRSGASAEIETRAPGYVLRIDPESVDASRFERLVGEADLALSAGAITVAAERAAAALELWRGRPLSEFAYRDFAQSTIVRLEELHAHALETRFEAGLAEGRHDQLVPELEAAVQVHPHRERLHTQLIVALYRSGRQADALEAHRSVRRALADELGIDPSPHLQSLERAILTQDQSLDIPAQPDAPETREAQPVAAPTSGDPMPPPLGRDAEHESVLGFLDQLASGCRGLLLEGEAGIGKTTVWEAGVAEARRRSMQVLSARAGASESQLSYAGLGDLLDRVLDDVLDELPMPQRRGLEAALALSDANTPPDPRVLGLALLTALRLLTEERPLVVAVDDLQWLDAPTADLLTFALRRLQGEPVGLLGSVRSGVAEAPDVELRRALAGRLNSVDVGPLSLGATHRMLNERLAHPLSRSVLRRIYERSGGNAFYALELARVVDERGSERLPDSLRSLVADRIEELPDDTRALLLAVALAMQPTLELVRALSAEEALDPAERAGVVVIEGSRLRFSHPLLAAAAQDAATTRERRMAHRRLAEAVDDPEQWARHLALAAGGPDEEIATALDEAAAAALARGAPAAAAELAEHALELTPPTSREALHRRRMAAAWRNQTIGNTRRQRKLLDEALAETSSDHERAEVLRQVALFTAEEGDLAAARETSAEALACAAGDDRLCASILLDMPSLDTGFGATLDTARAAVDHAEKSGDPALEAQALAILAQSTFIHGLGFRPDLFEQAVELEASAGFMEASALPTTTYGWAAKWAGEIELSRPLLKRSAARFHEQEDVSAAWPIFYLAWLHFIAGEWDQALERADESRQISLDAAMDLDAAGALITRATVEAHRGLLDEASEHLNESRPAAAALEPLWEYAAAFVQLSSGQPHAAAETLGPAVAHMIARGMEEPGLHPWFPTLADCLVESNRIEEAEELIGWMEDRAARLERRWALAMCARERGVIAGARGQTDGAIEALASAVEMHDGVGRPFDRAWTLLAYGQALRRAKQRRAARETLDEALAEFTRLGATVWAERTRVELGRIGGRAPASNELTSTEERTAALVAEGKTNKQVAAELHVTVRTVETNLSRIYAKLGLHSRTELAARRRNQ